MTKSVQPDLERQAAFWDARAAEFPDPREPIQRERLLRRLARLPFDARPGPARQLLDIGAGTGALALYAAEQGAVVTALDISAAMLNRLNEAAKPRRIATVRADWRLFDQEAAGFSGAFDVVCAQMVPSFREVTDFARMEACSRGWCVFIGWGRERHDPWLETAFAAHDVPWQVPTGVPLGVQCLRTLGRDPEPIYWSETWNRTRSAAAAIRDAADHLFVRGVDADLGLLRRELSKTSVRDQLVDQSVVEIGLLAWRIERRSTSSHPTVP